MKHLNIRIFGKVQRVFFRYSAKEKADQLNIKGLAKNMPDESLYLEAEGEEENLNKFIEWCKGGPSLAKVEKVSIKEEKIKKFEEFSVY